MQAHRVHGYAVAIEEGAVVRHHGDAVNVCFAVVVIELSTSAGHVGGRVLEPVGFGRGVAQSEGRRRDIAFETLSVGIDGKGIELVPIGRNGHFEFYGISVFRG